MRRFLSDLWTALDSAIIAGLVIVWIVALADYLRAML